MHNNQNEENSAIESLKEVAMAGIKEQRAARRWKIFFVFLFVLLSLLFMMTLKSASTMTNSRFSLADKYTAVIDIDGMIMPKMDASADNIIPALQDAFEDPKVKGIILNCNSPGGSPVQSSLIYDEIMRLRKLHEDVPVHAVASDTCASGGYFIISAAENIYANKSTLIGSIGVRMTSFGVVEAMEKIGVESREMTAGKYKALIDPFKPRDQEAETHIRSLLSSTHSHFINAVKAGRGDRLSDNDDIFTGLFWTGEDALKLGIIDDYGSVRSVAREIIKAEATVKFNAPKTFLDKLSNRVSTSITTLLLKDKIPQALLF